MGESKMMGTMVEPRHSVLDAVLSNPLGRLETLIDQEMASLRHANAAELKEFNNRKAQVLMELDRAAVANKGHEPSAEMKVRLLNVREKLENNGRFLKQHLDAVHEVIEMISENLRAADSDGTYTNGIRKPKDLP